MEVETMVERTQRRNKGQREHYVENGGAEEMEDIWTMERGGPTQYKSIYQP